MQFGDRNVSRLVYVTKRGVPLSVVDNTEAPLRKLYETTLVLGASRPMSRDDRTVHRRADAARRQGAGAA